MCNVTINMNAVSLNISPALMDSGPLKKKKKKELINILGGN